MGTLDAALREFEATEANLAKLDTLWGQIKGLQPSGPAFGSPPEYEALCLAFRRILPSMPAIDGFRIEDHLLEYDEAGQMQLDALELDEIEVHVQVANALEEQGRQLQQYRFHFQAKRRELVRDRLLTLTDEIDQLINDLSSVVTERKPDPPIVEPAWERLEEAVDELDMLLGTTARPPRWSDLQRHLHFGMMGDLSDIVRLDWPSVVRSLRADLYGDHDPVPVVAKDLGEIVAVRPVGPATTKLDWSVLNDEDFERLVFLLISNVPSYENPRWLQKTHAPDRGRDLSVDRIESNHLAGVRRYRTIIQCKHWLLKSVGPVTLARPGSRWHIGPRREWTTW